MANKILNIFNLKLYKVQQLFKIHVKDTKV